jgi:hypothetical protein
MRRRAVPLRCLDMARQEQDREDLLREATALVERAELHVAGFSQPVVAGYRRDGCGSVYFGPDEAYHFNTGHELRRAFRDGLLYKAERGRLVSLRRQRAEGEVQLLSHALNDLETSQLVDAMRQQLSTFAAALDAGEATVVGCVGDGPAFLTRLRAWLAAVTGGRIAKQPHAR